MRGMRPTFTVGHNTLRALLYYIWVYDVERFPFERDRIQTCFFSLLLAYLGARPGAIVESSSLGIRGSSEALLYKDTKLKLLRPANNASLLVLEVTIRLDKGKRKRPMPKTITLYENRECPAMCPIAHFLGLAFTDQVFHPDLLAAGLTPSTLHTMNIPEGSNAIEFKLGNDVSDLPIFRPHEIRSTGIQVHPSKALSANILSSYFRRWGERAGLPHTFTPYCLRREVGTELTGTNNHLALCLLSILTDCLHQTVVLVMYSGTRSWVTHDQRPFRNTISLPTL